MLRQANPHILKALTELQAISQKLSQVLKEAEGVIMTNQSAHPKHWIKFRCLWGKAPPPMNDPNKFRLDVHLDGFGGKFHHRFHGWPLFLTLLQHPCKRPSHRPRGPFALGHIWGWTELQTAPALGTIKRTLLRRASNITVMKRNLTAKTRHCKQTQPIYDFTWSNDLYPKKLIVRAHTSQQFWYIFISCIFTLHLQI